MNPYMMNYWNNALQQQQIAQQNMGQGLQSPEMPSLPPLAQQQLQGFNTGDELEEEAHNPINKGIARGIEAARQSMKASDEQQRRAAGMGLLSFAENLNRGQYAPGFAGTLQNINTALSPAIKAYIQEQKEAEALNAGLIANAQQQERQAMQDALTREKFEAEKEYRRKKLGLEGERIKAYRERGSKNEEAEGPVITEEGIDISHLPSIQSKQVFSSYEKDLKNIPSVLHELRGLKKMSDEYEKSTGGSRAPYGIGQKINSLKDLYANVFGGETEKKKMGARKTFESELRNFRAAAERQLKGGGQLAKGLYDIFEKNNTFPSEKDTKEVYDAKIDYMLKKIENSYGAGKMAVKYHKHIDPIEYEEYQNQLESLKNPTPMSEKEAIIEELRRRGKR